MKRPTSARKRDATAKKPAKTPASARWVAVVITHPTTDTTTEAVVPILPGRPPTRLYINAGPRPDDHALAAVVALCAVGRAAYVAVQIADGAIVEVTSIPAARAKDALEASTTSVALPTHVDAPEVLHGEGAGQVTLVA